MSITDNYGLYVTDDSSENFMDWRDKMNGTTDSNMTIIDGVLSSKANTSFTMGGVLLENGWVESGPSVSQELYIDGILEDQNGIISISSEATASQREAARKAALFVSDQDNGVLTIVADGETPCIDIPVQIIIYG